MKMALLASALLLFFSSFAQAEEACGKVKDFSRNSDLSTYRIVFADGQVAPRAAFNLGELAFVVGSMTDGITVCLYTEYKDRSLYRFSSASK